jgi:hypothetical protein
MIDHLRALCVLSVLSLSAGSTIAQSAVPAKDSQPVVRVAEGVQIQWFATLERGLAEAKRTGKPILFVSAAPHCAGVSGMW